MKTADLMEQRAAIVDRMNAAHTSDDNAAFETAENELRSIDTKLSRQRTIDAAERAERGKPLNGSTDEHLSRELRQFSVSRMIAHKAGLSVDAGREIEMQAELAKRAGKAAQGFYVPTEVFERRVQTTANAGDIVPTDYRPDLFVNALTATAVVRSLGATVLDGLTGNVEIPRETDSPNVAWVAENSALSVTDAGFDSLTLSPHHVGALSEISRNMIQQTSPSVEQLLRGMMARDIALEIDRAAINGTGVGAEPLGLLNDTDVETEAYTTDLFTTAANMIAAADLANVTDQRGFLSTNGVKSVAMKALDANNRPIGVAGIFHNEPIRFSNQAPNGLGEGDDEHALIYGYWPDFLIGVWSQLDVLVNPYAETAYSKGNLLIRAMATVDFGIRRPASFIAATGIDGAAVGMAAPA